MMLLEVSSTLVNAELFVEMSATRLVAGPSRLHSEWLCVCFQFERNWLKCCKHLKLCILHYNESGVIIHVTLNNSFLFNTRRTS